MMSPMTSMCPAVRIAVPRLQTAPCRSTNRRSPGRRSAPTARYAAVRMPFVAGLLPQVLAELVEELARRVRTPLERQHERGDPLVVVDELVLARVGVVDAIDVLRLERGVVLARRSDVVTAAARLVQIVVEVRAGRHQAVDVAVLDQMCGDEPHAAGAERAGHAEEDRAVVSEHLFPDAPRGREVAALEGNFLHPGEHLVGRKVRRHRERLDRHAQKTGLVRHARNILIPNS